MLNDISTTIPVMIVCTHFMMAPAGCFYLQLIMSQATRRDNSTLDGDDLNGCKRKE